eukprot:c9766_g2_i2.p1 GENE.c9766_g2_i2~~c9766_g2_i2.p1  ORF type:complete len:451 (-),score=72.95 c9766_g2_i2:89-1384(-)
MPEYLLVLAHHFFDFRLAELDAVAKYFNISVGFPKGRQLDSPYLFVEVASEIDVLRIASRMTLLRHVVDLWGHGNTIQECQESILACPAHKTEPYCGPNSSFKFLVEGFGKHYPVDEKIQLMEEFSHGPLPPVCDLKNPDILVWIMTDIGVAPLFKETDPPKHYYVGRQVCEGSRHYEYRIRLSARRYLGTTTTDAHLSLLFANQALAGPGKLVWDPCCGTASILVACGVMGATCFGSDLDYKVIHAKGGVENIHGNFDQYDIGKQLIDVGLMDICQHSFRSDIRFDAIVSDPPYGIREGSKKVHPNEESPLSQEFALKGSHATQTENMGTGFVVARLVEVAAESLVIGGRFVFLFPCVTATFTESQLPQHPCLRLVCHSEQPLGTRWGRRLVTMEKIAECVGGEKSFVQDFKVAPKASKTPKGRKQVENK